MNGPGRGWLGLLNPAAHHLRSEAARAEVARQLAALGVEVRPMPLDPAARLALIRDPGVAGVVACGGDGAVSMVANALDLERQTLAVLPCGRGNCVARDLGCGGFAAAMAALRTPKLRRIDLIEYALPGAAPALAVNALAFGRLAEVVARAQTWRAFADLGYTLAALASRPHARDYRIAIDAEPAQVRRAAGVVLLNTRHLGRYAPFPDVVADDGAIGVSVQPQGFVREKLEELRLFLRGAYATPARPAQRVAVAVAAPVALYVDGEILSAVEGLAATVRPLALRCAAGLSA